jgi:hypothetical protein
MQQHSLHHVALAESRPTEPLKTTMGKLERVDLVQREISVVVGDHLQEIDVPAGCPVMLRGERVKLRIIQPGDVVRVSAVARGTRFVAKRVEVDPVNSLPAAGKT